LDNLVSIIVPVYNRYPIIGQTLNSIISQNFRNWECIVVDDRSTDHIEELMDFYCEMDSRIHFYKGPSRLPKGANVCRNYGLEKSQGNYIQFFDSDDIMLPNSLELKISAIKKSGVDYIISKSENFSDRSNIDFSLVNYDKYYQFDKYKITNYNYVIQNINWLTPDFFAKREFILSVRFREDLFYHQERNYFAKVTAISTNAIILDDVLTRVRVGHDSIQTGIKKSNKKYAYSLSQFYYLTWQDLKIYNKQESLYYLFDKMVLASLDLKVSISYLSIILQNLVKQKQFLSTLYFLSYQLVFRISGRGLFLRKKFLKHFNNER